ncbi:MAG: cobalt-precorrin-5B (C(1))-methyltransferase [Pseudomonadota bacterium]
MPRKIASDQATPLRRGWTTGACATAAAKAGAIALLGDDFPDPVAIALPRGGNAEFQLAEKRLDQTGAYAAIVKDAGDDPDVTHGCLVRVHVRCRRNEGVRFTAGEGIGTVTKPGLALAPGEPAINPMPRRMIETELKAAATAKGKLCAFDVAISIPGGAALAEKTLNGRLGIVGGLSILGTTGVVVPFSCASWIHSIHRGIDVARATGIPHMAAATGSASEAFVAARYGLAPEALIDMGDFVGGTLKYLKQHPVPRLTIAGGIGKLVKLAQGAMDLHSKRSTLDRGELAKRLGATGTFKAAILEANTALEALLIAQAEDIPMGQIVAEDARSQAMQALGAGVVVEVFVLDRDSIIVGHAQGW